MTRVESVVACFTIVAVRLARTVVKSYADAILLAPSLQDLSCFLHRLSLNL